MFIDGDSATLSHHQSDLAFDTVGTFAGTLIVTDDTQIKLYNSVGTLLVTYNGPAGMVLQSSTVAPLSYAACPGCIFVTAMPATNIDNPTPSGDGEILTVAPGSASGSTAVFFATTTGIPEPESIHFITANTLKCNLGGLNYFATGYATVAQFNDPVSTTGAILGWTVAQLTPVVGHYLVQAEEVTGGPGAIWEDAGLGTQSLFSDTTSVANPGGYQLEDSSAIRCSTPATGCPATQGFWHKAAHWPHVTVAVDGVIYYGATDHHMIIGGITYTQSQLLAIMPSGSLHTGGYVNALSQFIAAVLNIAAGAQHGGIDTTLAAINTALTGTSFVCGTATVPTLCPISAALQATLTSYTTTLDNYNSAVGLRCSEAAGLNIP